MLDKLELAIIGCGARASTYAKLISEFENAEISILSDIDVTRAQTTRDLLLNKNIQIINTTDDIFSNDKIDAVIISTPDPTHADLACAALNSGKHVLLEKPMALCTEDCKKILNAARINKKVLQIAFPLRYFSLYRKIHQLISENRIGQIIGIEAAEHLSDQHGASLMRRWQRNSKFSGGLMLYKCSHEIDIFQWLAGSQVSKVSSFGGRNYFNPDRIDNKAVRCSECILKNECKYCYKEYKNASLDMKNNPAKYDLDLCVYTSDKDIVDNQVIILEYKNGVRTCYSIQMFGKKANRKICVTGTKGHIFGSSLESKIELHTNCKDGEFGNEVFELDMSIIEANRLLLKSFLEHIVKGFSSSDLPYNGLDVTATCIAIEKARKNEKVISVSNI